MCLYFLTLWGRMIFVVICSLCNHEPLINMSNKEIFQTHPLQILFRISLNICSMQPIVWTMQKKQKIYNGVLINYCEMVNTLWIPTNTQVVSTITLFNSFLTKRQILKIFLNIWSILVVMWRKSQRHISCVLYAY